MMNWLQKEDGVECERVCITKNHKSSLVQWAPIIQPVGLLSEELQGEREEGQGLPTAGRQHPPNQEGHLPPTKSFLRLFIYSLRE